MITSFPLYSTLHIIYHDDICLTGFVLVYRSFQVLDLITEVVYTLTQGYEVGISLADTPSVQTAAVGAM